MIVAALDLGSNSFHLLIAETTPQGLIAKHRTKSRVQLGAGLDADNNLSQEAIQRGLSCLDSFLKIMNQYDAHTLYAAATNTIRTANNAAQFIEPAESKLMHPIEVVSGEREAELIYRAVRAEIPTTEETLVIDIGGGSTEFAVGSDQQQPLWCDSLEMGCVSYRQRFYSDGRIYSENNSAAIAAASLCLQPKQQKIKNFNLRKVIGTSGTMQSIANLCHSLYGGHKNEIERPLVEDLHRHIQLLGDVTQLKFDALDANRQTILPSGVAITLAIMQGLEIQHLSIGHSTLCDGLLVDGLGLSFGQLEINPTSE